MPVNTQKPTVFYDGFCRLCGGFVSFLVKRDKAKKMRYRPLQTPEAQALLKIDLQNLDTIALHKNGRVYIKSAAALRALALLPGAWKLAPVFLIIPRPLRDAVYDFVGRNRYRWFGRNSTCFLPPGEDEER
jgi:predicted DCC family thiol-disulfide oxidoreductase YuxK